MTDNEVTLLAIVLCVIIPSILMILAYIIPLYLREKEEDQ